MAAGRAVLFGLQLDQVDIGLNAPQRFLQVMRGDIGEAFKLFVGMFM